MKVEEHQLRGGRMTPVARIGNSVRRSSGPWTHSIHRLLRHLRGVGFENAPEPYGHDSDGREVLSFIPGDVPHYPMPDYVWNSATLTAVARLIRRFHDVSATFAHRRDDRWQLPSHAPVEIVCHNDLSPENIVFKDGLPVAIFDFDLAAPGSRRWDLAYAAYRFVPLTDPQNPDTPVLTVEDQAHRLHLFLTSYGPDVDPQTCLEALIDRLMELVSFIRLRASEGDAAQKKVLDLGHDVIYERDVEYIRKNQSALAGHVPSSG